MSRSIHIESHHTIEKLEMFYVQTKCVVFARHIQGICSTVPFFLKKNKNSQPSSLSIPLDPSSSQLPYPISKI